MNIVVFLIIFYITDSSVQFGTYDNMLFIRGAQLFIIIVGVLCLAILKKIYKGNLLEALFVFACVVVSALVNRDMQANNIFVIILLFTGLFFSLLYNFEVFVKCYDDVLLALSIISLIFFCIECIAPVLLHIFPQIENISGYKFYNAILFVTSVENQTKVRQNYGIFREPGVYQMYLVLGILFQIYKKDGFQLKRVIIYMLTLLTTLSTTGYIMLLAIFFLLFVKSDGLKKKQKNIVIMLLPICLFFALYYIDKADTGYSIFGKFHGLFRLREAGETLNISMVNRIGSVIVNLHLFLRRMIFGNGLTEVYRCFPIVSNELFHVSLKYPTDTFIYHFSRFGVFYGCCWGWAYFRLTKILTKRKFERIIVFLIFLALLCTENYTNTIIIYILFWYGLIEKEKGIMLEKV